MVDDGDDVPLDALFHNGLTGRRMHNRFHYYYHKTFNQVFREVRATTSSSSLARPHRAASSSRRSLRATTRELRRIGGVITAA